MQDLIFKPGRLALALGTAAIIAVVPLHLEFGGDKGFVIKASQAIAKDSDRSGKDDSNDHDSGDDRGGNDDGSDHDSNDDHGGNDDGSDHDSNDDDGGDDDGNSQDGGDDNGVDDDSSDDNTNGASNGGAGGLRVLKVEVSNSGVEVRYSDGTKEEITNGRYERKNSAGRTVEQRTATQADVDRLMGLR